MLTTNGVINSHTELIRKYYMVTGNLQIFHVNVNLRNIQLGVSSNCKITSLILCTVKQPVIVQFVTLLAIVRESNVAFAIEAIR